MKFWHDHEIAVHLLQMNDTNMVVVCSIIVTPCSRASRWTNKKKMTMSMRTTMMMMMMMATAVSFTSKYNDACAYMSLWAHSKTLTIIFIVGMCWNYFLLYKVNYIRCSVGPYPIHIILLLPTSTKILS